MIARLSDNVAYGLRLRRLPRDAVAARVRQSLGLIRLDGLDRRLPRELSGGQQQRVALARSLVVEPDVLLMDEPLSNLDAKLRVSVRSEIREIQQRVGITTVYVTHDQEEALAISDTIAVMQAGALRQVDPPRAIYEAPADPWVAGFVGQVNLLRGTLTDRGLRLGPIEIPLPAGTAAQGEVLVALRPEAIRLLPPAGAQGWPAEVLSATYLGTTVRYRVRMAGQPLTVDDPDPAGKPPHTGPVRLAFDPARLRLWPATPERLARWPSLPDGA